VPPGGRPDRPVLPSTDSADPPFGSRNATVSGRARPGAPVSGAPADAARARVADSDDPPRNDSPRSQAWGAHSAEHRQLADADPYTRGVLPGPPADPAPRPGAARAAAAVPAAGERTGARPVDGPPPDGGRRRAGDTSAQAAVRAPTGPPVRPAGPATGPVTGSATGQASGSVTGVEPPSAHGTAVVPPVVPGHAGARPPALPGRAGAMAGSTSGVIPRPGESTAGRAGVAGAPGGGTGAITRGGTGAIGVGRATGTAGVGAVSGPVGTAPGRVSGAVSAAPVATPAPGTTQDDATGSGEPILRTAPGSGPGPTGGPGPGGIRGARSELRRQLRERRRLRMITLTVLTLVVLLALPAFFGIRAASRDPVFNSLDALAIPGWAASNVEDRSTGSRWCFIDCRFRERTAQSARPPAETAATYQKALSTAGWQRWEVAQCPEQPVEGYTCWKRDEFTLDLWVRQPACAADAVAAQAPGVVPTEGVVPATPDPKLCTGSTVSIKVRNAITDERGRPDQQVDPSHLGETPDVILTEAPTVEATPSPS
jgi:integrin beta 3